MKELTDRRWQGVKDVRVIIDRLNPVLRGWGNYFHTGNATQKFKEVDTYVWTRLTRFMVERKGRNLRGDEAKTWTTEFFRGHGLYGLRGTIRYPGTAQC